MNTYLVNVKSKLTGAWTWIRVEADSAFQAKIVAAKCQSVVEVGEAREWPSPNACHTLYLAI